jgi:hypothetical protein
MGMWLGSEGPAYYYYMSSTFNTFQHQPLPMLNGPPLEIHVKENARAHAIYTPATVPIHWKTKVKADLDRDVQLEVLEEVAENVNITWCHRMLVCRKHNGDPRRTVDLQHRYNKVTMGVKNVRRVIDDTLLYAKNLEEAFKQVAEYLPLVGENGIVLNSDKFCFGVEVVDWASVRLTED